MSNSDDLNPSLASSNSEFYPESNEDPIAPTGISSNRKKLIALLVGVLAIFIVGGVFAFSKLSGGGVQPEELLPADTVAFAKLDLNPSAGQKIEFVRFISHFSGTFKDFNSNDPIGSVLKQYTPGYSINWDEIKPWIGNRFAIAGVQGASGVTPVVVVGISDEAQMKYYLAKHQPDFKYVIKQGFAILADSQSTLDIVAASPTHLNQNATYKSDVAALGGSQVAVLWGDLKPLLKAAGSTIDSLASDQGLGSVTNAIGNTNGRVVLGIHFSSNSLAATFLTRGMSGSENNIFNASETDLGSLPEETLAGLSIAGLGNLITTSGGDNAAVQSALDYIGVSLGQIKALLSGPLTVVILPATTSDGSPLLALKLTPKDKAGALRALDSLINDGSVLSSIASQVVTDGSDIYVGTDAESTAAAMKTIKNTKSHLRDSSAYRTAIPNPGVILAYLNLQKLLPTLNITGEALKFSALALVSRSDKSLSGSSKTTLTITLK
ncbi:MAG: hypothetical protein WCH42_02915 [Actinomycetes bacterium]